MLECLLVYDTYTKDFGLGYFIKIFYLSVVKSKRHQAVTHDLTVHGLHIKPSGIVLVVHAHLNFYFVGKTKQ